MTTHPTPNTETATKKIYKESLNLPQTSFPMKAGAATREVEIQQFWEDNQVYQQSKTRRDISSKKFILHDGPPYLSSDKIHIGTALNKILKSIVTRYKYQRDHFSPYVPGYDGHGLPIEAAVEKKIKGGRNAVTPVELRKLCREFAMSNLKGQEVNFKRLGIWGDWDTPYVTIAGPYEATQIELFGQMVQKGYVYKGKKSVYWDPVCETALAEAEIEYEDHTSHSIYVRFLLKNLDKTYGRPLTDSEKTLLADSALVIWTTTPWTMPANVAMAVHPEFTYVVIQTEAWGKLVVAKDLLPAFAKACGLDGSYTEIGELPGTALEGLVGQHPFWERPSYVFLADYVTADSGTGIVHTAPGHGAEDFELIAQVNKRDDLPFKTNPVPVLCPINNKGCFEFDFEDFGTHALGQSAKERLLGQFYEKANPIALEILKEANALLGHHTYQHSYPHSWRSHAPVIFRATEQWFVNVDAFRKEALEAIKEVKWIPARGENRIHGMVADRSDWCISRQRAWGVPIPVFYCNETGQIFCTPESCKAVARKFRETNSDAWWELTPEELLEGCAIPEGLGKQGFTKEMDIMDVWFDSGVSHTAVVEARHNELGHLPVELYLEGSDQHRGWFQSGLLTSIMIGGKAPYKAVLTHGFALDEQGRKMSKSLGNVVDPQDIMKEYGADVLRLWVASVDYSSDVRIGKNMLTQLAEVYKKIRNTARFLLGNLADYNPTTDKQPYEKLGLLDQYILHELQQLIRNITNGFEGYQFHWFYQEIQNFCVVELSSLYLDVNKDILYCNAVNDPKRRAVQTVMAEILSVLVRMIVPVMPHLADDIWRNLPEGLQGKLVAGDNPVSVTLADWPEEDAAYLNESVAEQVKCMLDEKYNLINYALEDERKKGLIKSSIDAKVVIEFKEPNKFQELRSLTKQDCTLLLGVSQVEFINNPNLDESGYRVNATKAEGDKCERCWMYYTDLGTHADHPTLCPRCTEAVV